MRAAINDIQMQFTLSPSIKVNKSEELIFDSRMRTKTTKPMTKNFAPLRVNLDVINAIHS